VSAPGTSDLWSADDDLIADESAVRPYTVTGGRTRPSMANLAYEALVHAVARPEIGMTPERRQILGLTSGSYLSVAELSAHIHLPIGVVRVVVSDLARAGKVEIHGPTTSSSRPPANDISVLESVLNGIFSL